VSMSKLKDLEGHLTAVEADIAQPDKFVSCVEEMRQVRLCCIACLAYAGLLWSVGAWAVNESAT
jgi:hypothetical protein